MNGPRVQVTLPTGRNAFGTLTGPEYAEGPSEVLLDGMAPARLIDRDDWEYLPDEEQETGRG